MSSKNTRNPMEKRQMVQKKFNKVKTVEKPNDFVQRRKLENERYSWKATWKILSLFQQ